MVCRFPSRDSLVCFACVCVRLWHCYCGYIAFLCALGFPCSCLRDVSARVLPVLAGGFSLGCCFLLSAHSCSRISRSPDSCAVLILCCVTRRVLAVSCVVSRVHRYLSLARFLLRSVLPCSVLSLCSVPACLHTVPLVFGCVWRWWGVFGGILSGDVSIVPVQCGRYAGWCTV